MDELEEKIKKELSKSGFPLEIFCQRCLLKYKWGRSGSQYMIFEEEVRKQIDAMGHLQQKLDKNTTIFYLLHIECKKNHENPWVFFKEDAPYQHLLIEYENIKPPKTDLQVIHSIKDLHYHKTPLSSLYTMAFQSKGNQIYEAVLNLLSSYQFRYEFTKRHVEKGKPQKKSVHVDFLTILFDGKLYLANLEEGENITLVEKNHIIYYHREVKFPKFRHYNIEVVTKDYFSNYLGLLNKDVELISNFYRQAISA